MNINRASHVSFTGHRQPGRMSSARTVMERSDQHVEKRLENELGDVRVVCANCGMPLARWREFKCTNK